MNGAVTIRRARREDAEPLARLAAQLGYSTEPGAVAARLPRLITAREQLVLVAETDGLVCGWLQAHSTEVLESGFRVEIMGLVVDERHRRKGIGMRLVKAAEKWAAKLGAPSVVVRSNVTRVESHAFYPALGYAKTKTQAVYRKALAKEP